MGIRRFRGEHAFLSNFYPCEVEYDGRRYRTVEHAYQAAKVGLKSETAVRVRHAATPAAAKKIARLSVPVHGWPAKKLEVMETLLRRKFAKPRFRSLLLKTYPQEIVEENDWGDKFWGVNSEGEGENHLGLLLMRIRDGG